MAEETKNLFAVPSESDRLQFRPTISQYTLIRETNCYYYVMERGTEAKLHKSNTRFSYFYDLDEAKALLKKRKERVLADLEKRKQTIEERTTFSLNVIDPEPFVLQDDIKI